MSWENAIETANKLLDAQRRRADASTPAEAEAIITAAGAALRDESSNVVALLRAQSLDNLANRLTVAIEGFAAFARNPNRSEIRLVNVIDDHLRLLILELRPLVVRAGAQQPAATDVFPVSATVTALLRVPELDAYVGRLSAVAAFEEEALDAASVPVGLPQAVSLRVPVAQA